MLKFGFYKAEQISPETISGFFGKRRFIAIDLYNQISRQTNGADRDYILERMLNRFAIANKTFKYTHTQRFEDFDSECLKIITGLFPNQKDLTVHDIGVSDGRTTCDFFKKLYAIYHESLDYTASEYEPYIYSITINGVQRVIIDDNGRILQIVFPPFVFNTVFPESKIFYPINHIARYIANKVFVQKILDKYKAKDTRIKSMQVTLIHPQLEDLLTRHKNLHFKQHDILSGPLPQLDIIRVMNLLNHSYFDKSQMKIAVKNVLLSLRDGGLFITGSNLEKGSTVKGGIYKKENGRFINIQSSCSGSPINEIILKTEEISAASL